MKLYTIGFTQKSAETFFGLITANRVDMLVDIRLNPGGQLAGFAKQGDLAYFLAQLADGCRYTHMAQLAPTKEILSDYRKDKNWQRYVRRFNTLMDERQIPEILDYDFFSKNSCCLLCSEATADQCHRRLVAERMAHHWPNMEIVHL